MKWRRSLCLWLALLGISTPPLTAQDPSFLQVVVRDDQVAVDRVAQLTIDEGQKLPFILIEQLAPPSPTAQAANVWRVRTVSGEILVGLLDAGNDEVLRVATKDLGTVTLRLDELVSAAAPGQALPEATGLTDRINFRNGDVADGFFAGVAVDGQLLLDTDSGQVSAPLDSALSLAFAGGSAAQAAENAATHRVLRADGSLLEAQTLERPRRAVQADA